MNFLFSDEIEVCENDIRSDCIRLFDNILK